MRSVEFVRVEDFEVPWLAFRPTTDNPVRISIILLDDNVFLTCADIFVSGEADIWLSRGALGSGLSVRLLRLGGHRVSFIMLKVVQFDLPDV